MGVPAVYPREGGFNILEVFLTGTESVIFCIITGIVSSQVPHMRVYGATCVPSDGMRPHQW